MKTALRVSLVIITTSLAWQVAAPALFAHADACGLPFPHSHILLPPASWQDLPAHRAAELACYGRGARDAVAANLPGANPRGVISVVSPEQWEFIAGALLLLFVALLVDMRALPERVFSRPERRFAFSSCHRAFLYQPDTPPPEFAA